MEDIELVFSKYYKYVKRYALSLCYDETFVSYHSVFSKWFNNNTPINPVVIIALAAAVSSSEINRSSYLKGIKSA